MHQFPEGGTERHDVQLPLVSPLGSSADSDVREYKNILVLVPLGDELFEEVGRHGYCGIAETKPFRSPARNRSTRPSALAVMSFSNSSASAR